MKSHITICKNNHQHTEQTSYVDKKGRRICRTCRQISQKKQKEIRKKLSERFVIV